MRRIRYTVAMLMLFLSISAQERITLDQAITIALESNYDIKIEQSNLKVSKEEFNRGGAGYYPTVFANGSYEQSYVNMEAEYDLGVMDGAESGSNSTTIEGSGVNSKSYSAGVGFSYNLFEGGGKKYRYRSLQTAYELSELQLNNQIEMTIVEVGAAYLEVARNRANLDISIENMEISKERFQRAEVNAKYGTISDLILLQSLSFLNSDSTLYRSAEVNLKNSMRQLNLVMGLEPDRAVRVYSEVQVMEKQNLDKLMESALDNNTLVVMANSKIGLSENALNLAKSAYYPTLSLSGQYGAFRQDSEQNLIVYQQNLGFTGGATLTIPIFAGNQRRTKINTTRARVDQEQLTLEKTIATVKTNLLDSYEQYSLFIKQLSIEKVNIDLYQKNFEKATEDYINGVVSSTEVRETQNSLAEAKVRIFSLKYNIKLFELILNQLSGNLIESHS